MFYLGEYVNTVTVAAVAVTLFLGGWHGPQFHGLRLAVAAAVVPASSSRVIYVMIWSGRRCRACATTG